jgi:hypothetical protein
MSTSTLTKQQADTLEKFKERIAKEGLISESNGLAQDDLTHL